MTAVETGLTEATAEAIVACLEQDRWYYAILRNYEQFPHISHDLDIVLTEPDVPRFRNLLIALARQYGWSALTECSHWSGSKVREHNIEIFRFYRISPPAYLQLDVFHGFLVLGLPLLGEHELLNGRTKTAGKKLTHIDCRLENVLRLLQICGLLGVPGTGRKIDSYVERVLGFASQHAPELRRKCGALLGRWAVKALERLQTRQVAAFRRRIKLAKASFAAGQLFKRPLRSCSQLVFRGAYIIRTWIADPCGEVITVCAPGKDSRERLEHAMKNLAEAKCIHAWTSRGYGRRVLERGGVVVKWVSSGAHIDARHDTVQGLERAIIQRQIARHKVLYLSEELAR